MIRENQKILNNIQIVLDLIIVILGLVMAYWIRFIDYEGSYLGFASYLPTLILLLPLYLFLYYLFGLYEPRRRKSVSHEIVKIMQANFLSMMILFSLFYLIKEINYSRQVIILFVIITSIFTILERVILRLFLINIRKQGYNRKHVLVIGANRLAKRLITKLKDNSYLGYEVVGIVDDDFTASKTMGKIPIIGVILDLENIIRDHEIDEIFITVSAKNYEKFRQIIMACEKSGVRTQIVPDYARFIPAKPEIDEIDGIPLINIRHVPLDNVLKAISKRAFDLFISAVGLLICSPIFLLMAISIKLDSPGSVLFTQERVGLNKKKFMMYKFRTMKVQVAEKSNSEWTTKEDPRKTRLGTFLRKTSLDELPQLWNVLKGDMSLVGPRPERPFFVKQFKERIPRYMIKHHVRPGITGWAQVNGWRGDTSIRKRIDCDIYYIENWTFMFDIKILFMTVFKGFVNKNAY